MDASVLIEEEFWKAPSPCVLGEMSGGVPEDDRLRNHVLFQTSGSMGVPQWVALSKPALMASARVVNQWLGVRKDSIWGLALPWHHVGGFGVAARSREAGSTMAHFALRWDPREFARWIDQEKVTHTSLVPTQVHDLVAANVRAPESLQAVVVGGGCLAKGMGQAARDLGWPVLASYGMTEAGSQIATQGLEVLASPYQPAPISLLPHWRAKVDEEGRLSIAGEALFSGWLAREKGAWVYQTRVDEWYETRDLVNLESGLLTPQGRVDLQVKVLGELVDVEALEATLVDLSKGAIEVGSFVVVPVPDERAGHRLVPVWDGCCDRGAVEELMHQYSVQAAGYCRLQPPRFLDPLPRSTLGKPRRSECLQALFRKSEDF